MTKTILLAIILIVGIYGHERYSLWNTFVTNCQSLNGEIVYDQGSGYYMCSNPRSIIGGFK